MTKATSSLGDLGGRLWVIGIEALDGVGKIDEVLDKITK
jgi:hypothetical protein